MESGGTGDMMAVTRESEGWWIAVTAQQDQRKGVYQSADEDLVLDLLSSHEIPLAPGNDSSLRWRKACFLDWIFCKDHHGTGSHQRPEAMLVSIVHAVAPGFNEAWDSCRSMQSVLPWGGHPDVSGYAEACGQCSHWGPWVGQWTWYPQGPCWWCYHQTLRTGPIPPMTTAGSPQLMVSGIHIGGERLIFTATGGWLTGN